MMPKDKVQIQDEVFKDFEKSLTVFYDKREQRYFSELKKKVESGVIDLEQNPIKKIALEEAEKFMSTRVKELSLFIRNYVDTGIDDIRKKLESGCINKEEANVHFEVLKYILLAGENEEKQ